MHGLNFSRINLSRINLSTVLALNETRIQGAIVECRARGFVFIKHQWPNKIRIRFNCRNHRSFGKKIVHN